MRNFRIFSGFIRLLAFLTPYLVLHAAIPAFPGAEGGGMYTTGGRGGDVYIITNLNDSGPGSLREAVENFGPRTVVFAVSGTIHLESDLDIRYPDITIAGQTAPGDGITLADHWMEIKAPNVIIRYIRFRLGDQGDSDSDAFGGRYSKNIIIDHCSASWSIDEVMSLYGNDSTTVQWCIISESLYMSHHEKGAHGYGGIWGGSNTTFHHNLIAHHSSRNPRFAGGETSTCKDVDFRNNVIYNWGFNSVYGGENGTFNMVANYYKPGPATKSSVRNRIVEPGNTNSRWFIADNFVDGDAVVSGNNWFGGVQGSSANPNIIKVEEPFPFLPIHTDSAHVAFERVLAHAGASIPYRDPVDARVVEETRNGTATYEGRWYEIKQGLDPSPIRGIIDSVHQVGGWPELISLTAPQDSDSDGMPDEWESFMFLDPEDPEDRNEIAAGGYTMLEEYINSLADDWVPVGVAPRPYMPDRLLVSNYPNPFNAATTIRLSLPNTVYLTVKVYSIRGELLDVLFKGRSEGAEMQLNWNASDKLGRSLPSGIYLISVETDNMYSIRKVQLIK